MAPRLSLLTLLVLGCLLPARVAAQEFADRPKVFVPQKPPTKKELDHRASLHQYVLGLLCEREDRLLEALRAFEQAGKLDPDAAAAFKAQIPILLALDRSTDALIALGRVLTLDPDDHETWFLSARVHKSLGQYKDARNALAKGLKCSEIKEHPEIAQQMHLDLAGLHEAADELPQAVTAYAAAVDLLDHPELILENTSIPREAILAKAAETYEKIGHLYRRQKQFDAALAAYKKAQARYPDGGGRLNYNLAHLALEMGQPNQALTYLDAYLRLQPLGLEAYELKLRLLGQLNRQAEVFPWLEQAVKNDRHNVGLKLLLADQYREARQFAAAEKLYQGVAADAPSADAFKGLFRLHRADPSAGMTRTLTQINAALEEANQKPSPPPGASTRAKAMLTALRDDGELAKDLVQVAFRRMQQADKLSYSTLHFLAVLADKHKKPEEAEAFYRHCLLDNNPATQAAVYSGYLRVLYKARKFQEILKVCDQGLETGHATNKILFYNEKARALSRLGKLEEAIAATDKAIERAGDQERLWVQNLRIRLLTQAEKFDQAEKECQQMLKDNPGPGEALEIRYLLSSVYAGAKQTAKSEEELAFILRLDPDNATANNDLGYSWADQGKNLKEAEFMIRRALEQDRRRRKQSPQADDQDHAAYVDSLGWALFRQGRIDEAKNELERAIALPDGEDPVIWDHLGDVYYRLEQLPQAHAAWHKSARLYEQENLRRRDERYREVLRKIKMVESEKRR